MLFNQKKNSEFCLNFPSYTLWHLSFEAAHNSSQPVCHPSVELYQLPTPVFRPLILSHSSLSHGPGPANNTQTAFVFPPIQHTQQGAAPGQEAINSAGVHLSALLPLKAPEAFEPHSKIPKHHPTHFRRPTHYCAVKIEWELILYMSIF